jgi:hypothetical protein
METELGFRLENVGCSHGLDQKIDHGTTCDFHVQNFFVDMIGG